MSEQLSMFGKGGGRERKRRGSGGNGAPPPSEIAAPLHEEARRRYLNYALSVITSRALPDVRDGLKPVQRRIIYGMFQDHRLTHEAKYQKCAKVVGTIMGQYHPHGDVAIYDALVRMAQDFSLRYPLVDGHGNFGSLDGDSAAAMRYTECRLAPLASELLVELSKRTVDYRPTYDGTMFEPIVIPARLPQLLMNGTTGIAVGMATNIPPHNLGELCDALIDLSRHKDLEVKDLLKHIKGPDFPTGGQILNSKSELRQIYETGQGSVRVRGEWKMEEMPRGGRQVVVTSIPYAVNKSNLVAKFGELVRERKLTPLVDVRDESTKDVRIVLEIKRDADPELVMAYLYKHTPLQTNFGVNLTCLVPTANPEVGAPKRLDLKSILRHFLDFRFDVVTRRFEYDLKQVQQRLHILEGFHKVYDALDEMLKIGRAGSEEVEYSEEAFIADEDAQVVLTRDGWIKRVRELKDPSQTRVREGDEVAFVLGGSLKSNLVVFSNFGTAYVTRFNDVPASTGYGDPVQKLFKFDDNERVVGALSLDKRLPRPEKLLGLTRAGYGLRFALAPHTEVSTRAGRRFSRPAKDDELIGVVPVEEKDFLAVVTEDAYALVTKAKEVNELAGAGRGARVIKVQADDKVVGFLCTADRKAELPLETSKGRKLELTVREPSGRGGKGRQLVRKDTVKALSRGPVGHLLPAEGKK